MNKYLLITSAINRSIIGTVFLTSSFVKAYKIKNMLTKGVIQTVLSGIALLTIISSLDVYAAALNRDLISKPGVRVNLSDPKIWRSRNIPKERDNVKFTKNRQHLEVNTDINLGNITSGGNIEGRIYVTGQDAGDKTLSINNIPRNGRGTVSIVLEKLFDPFGVGKLVINGNDIGGVETFSLSSGTDITFNNTIIVDSTIVGSEAFAGSIIAKGDVTFNKMIGANGTSIESITVSDDKTVAFKGYVIAKDIQLGVNSKIILDPAILNLKITSGIATNYLAGQGDNKGKLVILGYGGNGSKTVELVNDIGSKDLRIGEIDIKNGKSRVTFSNNIYAKKININNRPVYFNGAVDLMKREEPRDGISRDELVIEDRGELQFFVNKTIELSKDFYGDITANADNMGNIKITGDIKFSGKVSRELNSFQFCGNRTLISQVASFDKKLTTENKNQGKLHIAGDTEILAGIGEPDKKFSEIKFLGNHILTLSGNDINVSQIVTTTNGQGRLHIAGDTEILTFIGAIPRKLSEIKLLGDYTLTIFGKNINVNQITTKTDDQGKLLFKGNEITLGNALTIGLPGEKINTIGINDAGAILRLSNANINANNLELIHADQKIIVDDNISFTGKIKGNGKVEFLGRSQVNWLGEAGRKLAEVKAGSQNITFHEAIYSDVVNIVGGRNVTINHRTLNSNYILFSNKNSNVTFANGLDSPVAIKAAGAGYGTVTFAGAGAVGTIGEAVTPVGDLIFRNGGEQMLHGNIYANNITFGNGGFIPVRDDIVITGAVADFVPNGWFQQGGNMLITTAAHELVEAMMAAAALEAAREAERVIIAVEPARIYEVPEREEVVVRDAPIVILGLAADEHPIVQLDALVIVEEVLDVEVDVVIGELVEADAVERVLNAVEPLRVAGLDALAGIEAGAAMEPEEVARRVIREAGVAAAARARVANAEREPEQVILAVEADVPARIDVVVPVEVEVVRDAPVVVGLAADEHAIAELDAPVRAEEWLVLEVGMGELVEAEPERVRVINIEEPLRVEELDVAVGIEDVVLDAAAMVEEAEAEVEIVGEVVIARDAVEQLVDVVANVPARVEVPEADAKRVREEEVAIEAGIGVIKRLVGGGIPSQMEEEQVLQAENNINNIIISSDNEEEIINNVREVMNNGAELNPKMKKLLTELLVNKDNNLSNPAECAVRETVKNVFTQPILDGSKTVLEVAEILEAAGVNLKAHAYIGANDSVLNTTSKAEQALLFVATMQNVDPSERKEVLKQIQTSIENSANLGAHQAVTGRMDSVTNMQAIGIASGEGVASGDEDDLTVQKGVWISGLYGKSKQSGSKGYDGKVIGASVGFDLNINDDSTVIGLAYTNAGSDFKYKTKSSSKAKVRSHVMSVYGQQEINQNWLLSGIFSFSNSCVNTKMVRNIATANGKFKNNSYSMEGSLGYKLPVAENISLLPQAGIRYSKYSDGAYTETGAGVQNISVASKSGSQLTGIIGGKILIKQKLSETLDIIPILHANVESNLKSRQRKARGKFVWSDNYFESEFTEKPAKLAFNTGASVVAKRNNLEGSVSYNLHTYKKFQSHQGSLKLKLMF